MVNAALPEADDWNRYWSLDKTARFTKISWSKRRIMERISPHVKKGAAALDAGCGSGFFSKYFCEEGMRTVAADYSREALDIAGKMTQGKAQPLKIDFLTEQIRGKTGMCFDIIFSDGLFEHFSEGDQDAIMKNFSHALDENGVIATFVPNCFSPWELIRPLYMPGIREKPFTLKQLVELNERNGLAVLNKGGINTLPVFFSPDRLVGSLFGMLLFTIARKK